MSTEIPGPLKFRVGQKIEHARFGSGRVIAIYAVAVNPGEVHEYEVKLKGDRYPAILTESETWAL